MAGSYSEKEYRDAIVSVERGAAFWEQLTRELPVVPWRYYVFLFSEDDEINQYTLRYLPVLQEEKNASEFVIITADPAVTALVHRERRMPYILREISKSLRNDVCNFFVGFSKRFQEYHILLNGAYFPEEEDVFRLLEVSAITKQDIAVVSVLGLKEIPDEEKLKACTEKDHAKRIHYKPIDWGNGEKTVFLEETDNNVDYYEMVEQGVRKLLHGNVMTRDDEIVLCTATKTTQHIVEMLADYHVVAIIDNDPQKAGHELLGIPIYQTEAFLTSEQCEKCKFIVPTRSYRAICEQLNYYGCELNQRVFVTYSKNDYYSAAMLEEIIRQIEAGKKLFDQLREAYPNKKLLLCPYPGTGDAFLLGMYLKDVVGEDETAEYMIIVTSNSCRKVIQLFGEDAVVLSRYETEQMLLFIKIMGSDKTNTKILNDMAYHLIGHNLRGHRGIDFHSLFQGMVFGAKSRLPFPKVSQGNADHIFREYGLKKGKTVLLSPYEKSLRIAMDDRIWEEISERLKEDGYTVCTNVAEESERAVKGTVGLLIPYSEVLDFLDKAGGFISIRNGLCDVVAGTTAKKVILYPKKIVFDNTTAYEYFSLEKMGLAKDNLTEVEFHTGLWDELIEAVLRTFQTT